MKRFTLITALLASVASFTAVNAQSFKTDRDTTKMIWAAPGGSDMEVHNDATNLSASPIALTWKVTYFHKDPGWGFNGFCDNNLCRVESEPGLVDGTKTFTTMDIPAGKRGDFHALFNGDAAANKTSSVISVLMTNTVTGDNTIATFIGYKDATGLVNITRLDESVTLYPNPAQNYIDVRYNSTDDVKTISVYNIIGKLINVYRVSSNTSAHCEFNTDMPSGIYLMRIADSKGNIIATRKFTRQ